jgi:signal transduction histidine kinase
MVAASGWCDHRGIHDRPFPPTHSHWGAPARPRRHRHREHASLRRRCDDRLLGGIAGALAARTGRDVTLVRVGLVIAGLFSGFGVAAYVVVWLLVPVEDEDESIGMRALHDRRGLTLAAAVVPGLVAVLLVASAVRAGWLGTLAWPLSISAAGLVLVWRNGSDAERGLLRRAATPLVQVGTGFGRSWTGLLWRIALGAVLAAGGAAAVTGGHHYAPLRLGGVALILAAFVVVFGPWWLNVARELVVERQARLRAEERADLAARVHDSVLQTLALIQRHSAEPQRVAQLARAQERELRSWLFEGEPPGSFGDGQRTVAAAVRHLQGDIEAAHGTPVEAVVVGDCPLTENLGPLLAAGREATVNAAKWSGAPVISLFVEVEEGKVSLFVRDRGRGFDPLAVAPDRRGITQSITGRMARAGGQATIRSAPGGGTEVELTMACETVAPGPGGGG